MKQFIKFMIVGFSNTLISYAIYLGCLKLFETANVFPDADYFISSVISFALSILWAFYWNNKYTFKKEDGEQRPWLRALLKTYVSYGFTGIILNNALLFLWVEKLGIPKEIAPIINLSVTIPINFILNKYWAFRGSRQTDNEEVSAVDCEEMKSTDTMADNQGDTD